MVAENGGRNFFDQFNIRIHQFSSFFKIYSLKLLETFENEVEILIKPYFFVLFFCKTCKTIFSHFQKSILLVTAKYQGVRNTFYLIHKFIMICTMIYLSYIYSPPVIWKSLQILEFSECKPKAYLQEFTVFTEIF